MFAFEKKYTGVPKKRRRVHNSVIYRKILIICTLSVHQIKWLLIGYKMA
jgi:hypothetical protein